MRIGHEGVVSFHEATVTSFSGDSSRIRLTLADVRTDDGFAEAEIAVTDVTAISIDRQPAESVAMEHPDGEVVTLERSEKELKVIVQWNDFRTQSSSTRSYVIDGRTTTRIEGRSF